MDQSVSAQPCLAPALGFQPPFPVAPAVVKSSALLPRRSLCLLTLELSLAFLGVKAGLRHSLCHPTMVGAGAAPIPRSDPTGPTGVLALDVPEGAEESHSEA